MSFGETKMKAPWRTNTTWRKSIIREMENYDESFNDLIHCTISNEELDREFDQGYGSPGGAEFTAWAEKRVYFPVMYDGAEWVGSVPRNPCDESTPHIGG